MEKNHTTIKLIPTEFASYISPVVARYMQRINASSFKKIVLLGFSENMRMLSRLLNAQGKLPILCDWRNKFVGYDCGGKFVESVDTLAVSADTLIVLCVEDITLMKEAIWYLFTTNLSSIPVIYDRSEIHDPFHQEQPFKAIREKAINRATSMISEPQLFDLVQFIRNTSEIEGDVVEYGSLYGGSGAVIVEAVKHYCSSKNVKLFDSFEGIPESKYGLDYHWNKSFSDNSFAAVRDAFNDCSNVEVIKGDIRDTYLRTGEKISFGYLASDTIESGELLLNFMWPKLSVGGIIAICDYGSFPNAIPLTTFVDRFFEGKKDAFVFHPANLGLFVIKR
jgi:O-methyltransferase